MVDGSGAGNVVEWRRLERYFLVGYFLVGYLLEWYLVVGYFVERNVLEWHFLVWDKLVRPVLERYFVVGNLLVRYLVVGDLVVGYFVVRSQLGPYGADVVVHCRVALHPLGATASCPSPPDMSSPSPVLGTSHHDSPVIDPQDLGVVWSIQSLMDPDIARKRLKAWRK